MRRHKYPLKFSCRYESNKTHTVAVELYEKVDDMRVALRERAKRERVPGNDYSGTLAACLKHGTVCPREGHLCTLFFSHDRFCIEDVAHEATHAAFYRALVRDKDPHGDEEDFAIGVGVLTEGILSILKEDHGICVKVRKPESI